ncbi:MULTISPECIES: alpha/beta hydrolase [unclassified Bosea (in: a-proteobacteria)]|uniref:alpha/beta fold hydrolase n=1 Tax=unclassified Bosea (in: a-proteobacteria) TaxID=2653178 RepID=UPI0009566EE0|nr:MULTISPECIES: alpha/beta hydrolase [unclassified Bosea (in: a-proteobacteria)]TAJ30393.1 MAG: alpha/beta hydrolase [Bosea sp. (in: a-proteobacteria)]SIQ24761.1 Pimeloyl-ACP methyl ester carboxylesterase [Bosea sp. TND4EK4]
MRARFVSIALGGALLSLAGSWSGAQAATVRNIVIVHGAFADGSGWRQVSDRLTTKGYNVTIVQEPLTSLQEDVAATRRVLALQDGPAILVGHSYAGMVITDAGNDAKVAGLVYVAAFQPEKGESLGALAARKPVPNAPPDAIKATEDGYLHLDPQAFPAAFAGDLPKAEAEFLARSQVFAAKAAFSAEAGDPAWKSKPSWALVASHDRSINPELEREMARRAGSKVREVASSHAVYLSKPAEVAALIVEAAEAVSR